MNNLFGEFTKEQRSVKRLGLREFCLAAEYDPSNWSKIERGILPPPQDKDTLLKVAGALGIVENSQDWNSLVDFSAVDAGRIPEYVLEDQELLKKLPVFFRTITGKKPTREDLIKLAEILKKP